MLERLIFLILTFLIAGIPFGLIFTKIFRNIDVRTVGSGNIGATNVFRAAGLGPALLTAICDASKSLFPTLIAKNLFPGNFAFVVALVAVTGHCFSPYLKFRGGKGVATMFGAFFALNWKGALIAFSIWILTVIVTGFVSFASIIASLIIPLYLFIINKTYPGILALVIAAVIIIRHRSNIKRLVRGEEPRTFKK